MTFDQSAIIVVIVVLLFLFIWGKWRYDIVALTALFSCSFLGLVPTDQVFSGFGHPATITVLIVLILSYGLTKSGAVEGIIRLVSPVSSIPSLHIALLIFIAAFLSMFMNNVGALALLMPVAIQSTVKAGRSPATVLMPLSFGSILGGLVTLIGTPPNIIIASYREKVVGLPFTMFDYSPVGGVVAIAGIIFMACIGWRLVKVRKATAGTDLFEIEDYLFEVKVVKGSALIDKTIKYIRENLNSLDVEIISLIHKKQKLAVVPINQMLTANDVLLVEGPQEDIDKFISKFGLSLVAADSTREEILHSVRTETLEVVVAPRSSIEGKLVENIRFKRRFNVNLLGIFREGRQLSKRIRSYVLRAGDVLLLHGEKDDLADAIGKFDCYPLAKRNVDFGMRKMALRALFVFIVAIGLASTGILPIQIALGSAVVVMALLNIVPVREFYDGVDWPVIILLGAMIPVGSALETTGATQLIADLLLRLTEGLSVTVILALLLIITMTLSDILNNAATAVLMAPIANTVAQTLGANPDPFLMSVAVGASCAFLTPIGHQNNALVMGPGGYKFSDYWRIGLPLEIIIALVATPMIMYVWPVF